MQALRHLRPFELTLDEPGAFQHAEQVTGYLAPSKSSTNDLVRLRQILADVIPACTEQGAHDTFTPHLTLGQWPTQEEALRELRSQQVQTNTVAVVLNTPHLCDGHTAPLACHANSA